MSPALSEDLDALAISTERTGSVYVAWAALRFTRLASSSLYRETARLGSHAQDALVAATALDRWRAFGETLARLLEPLEATLVLAPGDAEAPFVGFVVRATARRATIAKSQVRARWATLRALVEDALDMLEFEAVTGAQEIHRVRTLVTEVGCAFELRRGPVETPLSQGGAVTSHGLGFTAAPATPARTAELVSSPLSAWVPAPAAGTRVFMALARDPANVRLVVNFRGVDRAPEGLRASARAALARLERVAQGDVAGDIAGSATLLRGNIERLRRAAYRRVAELDRPLLAVRAFIVADGPPSAATIAVLRASVEAVDAGSGDLLDRPITGSELVAVRAAEVRAPLADDDDATLLSAAEATAVLRVPEPGETDLPGLPLARSRTARPNGRSGTDTYLGLSVHRGLRTPVRFDGESRFRHTYVVGQTGTGKSTLLLHMALQDICAGRGVAVLDPHGPLVEGLLSRIPPERADDVVLLDVTDVERPMPFNPLRLHDTSMAGYRQARDLLIDDLFQYLRRNFNHDMLGPIFETHMRGMMGLLLGTRPQAPPQVPTLMHLNLLYSDDKLRERLISRVKGDDPVMDQILTLVERGTHDSSLNSVAQYVTSKFTRFVGDLTLRNLTCQQEMLDIDGLVAEGKILLFYLGKGRFGDIAAGLLASQVISRLRSAVMRRGVGSEHPPFYVYADEFQLFADDRIGELLSEARKFGLSMTLAHQFLGQLPPNVLQAVLGNVGSVIAFRVGAPDAEQLAPTFAPTFNASDLVTVPNYRTYVRSFGPLGDTAFSVDTPPPPAAGDRRHANVMRELSRARYGRDVAVVEGEVRASLDLWK